VQKLLAAGYSVAAVDCIGTGEFTADGKPVEKQRLVAGPKIGPASQYAGYTFGYNHSLVAQRAHDLLSLVSFVQHHDRQPAKIQLLATGGSAPWVAAARFAAGSAVDRVAIDTQGFRFEHLTSFDDPNFWPGTVKYGDLQALLDLGAPGPLWVAGETEKSLQSTAAIYKSLGAEKALQISDAKGDAIPRAAVEWLIAK
jgi:hypothetical protein